MPRPASVSRAPRVQCLVCGCADVRTDEVLQAELIYLAECPRCVAQLKTYESTLSLLRSIRDEDLPKELRCRLKAFVDKRCSN